jgi:hypothetical protein
MVYADLKRLLGREPTDVELGTVVTAKVIGDRRPLWLILKEADRSSGRTSLFTGLHPQTDAAVP